jgi:UDP-N-acetylmuramate dehydrogenase
MRAFFARSVAETAFSGDAVFNEPMAGHTTFGIGGPADLYVRPAPECFLDYTASLLRLSRAENIPVFIIGGGSNLLVSDAGIRGVVLDMGAWSGVTDAGMAEEREAAAVFRSGTPTDEAVRWAVRAGYAGLEDFAGLPGTIGGAVWMNARCYDSEMSGILAGVTLLDESFRTVFVPADGAGFGYKKSPFQSRDVLIISAALSLRVSDRARTAEKTESRRVEREAKGHFRCPSAGSIFKNSREHGKPAGKIIEELGLRGVRSGGAQIAPWHGNFIINTGGATADDVKRLIALAEERALQRFGFRLEREVIFAG